MRTLTHILLIAALFVTFSCSPQQDYEKIFKKAQEFEKRGQYHTALYAYQVIKSSYGSSPRAAEAIKRIEALEKKIGSESIFTTSTLAKYQKADLNQGRTVKTAIGETYSLDADQERELLKATEELMKSVGIDPTSDLPAPARMGRSVPVPVIEKIYCPPIARVGEPVYIKILARNVGLTARQGGISVSFPDKPDNIIVFQSHDQKVEITRYKQGSKLYSGALGAYIVSTDPMIETYHWSKIERNSLYSFSAILIPDQSGILRLFIRSALRGQGKNFYNYPTDGPIDQQSYSVLEYAIYVKE